jgi:uncharacterized protein (DUF4415 family)
LQLCTSVHTLGVAFGFEWDSEKARVNFRKHGIDLARSSRYAGRASSVLRESTVKRHKEERDFSRARRGAVVPVPPGKTRITIRIDTDILKWFRRQVHAAGGGNYQTLMNEALREHLERRQENLEDTLRRVVREEMQRMGPRRK